MTPRQVQSAKLPLRVRRFVRWRPTCGNFTALLPSILSLVLANCNQPTSKRDQVSLTMIDQGWFDKEIRDARDLELRQFTQETGIRGRQPGSGYQHQSLAALFHTLSCRATRLEGCGLCADICYGACLSAFVLFRCKWKCTAAWSMGHARVWNAVGRKRTMVS